MKSLLLAICSGLGLCVATALGQSDTATTKKEEAKATAPASNEVAVIKTTKGDMVVEFWPDVAPKTVENFKKLARDKFYDGTCFHRIVKGFMIQGGDPLTKDPEAQARYGTGDPGYKIKAEFNNRKHVRGVLSMARSANPDSAGSQFFVCLDAASHLDNKYTCFGRVIRGEDVLLKIGETPTKMNAFGTERSVPTERIGVETVRIVPADSIR
ncbi:MAG TPA: peptidylprolyl isomerase [Verrucomicrobiota bacterium]|nr:peptidylprolyl isomerase [Verrucomicrobiota bacterium]